MCALRTKVFWERTMFCGKSARASIRGNPMVRELEPLERSSFQRRPSRVIIVGGAELVKRKLSTGLGLKFRAPTKREGILAAKPVSPTNL